MSSISDPPAGGPGSVPEAAEAAGPVQPGPGPGAGQGVPEAGAGEPAEGAGGGEEQELRGGCRGAQGAGDASPGERGAEDPDVPSTLPAHRGD